MRAEVARDLSDSAYDFLRVVWPAIRDRLGGGRLEPVEATAPKLLARDLDVLAGIDAWQMLDHHNVMRGLASRIQWPDPPKDWRSFTIRCERPNGAKTELDKRIYALDHREQGWLIPALTIQAYLTEPRRRGRLISAGIVRTDELYAYVREHPDVKPRRNPSDGVWFKPYFWDELRRSGVRVGIVSDGPPSLLDDWPQWGEQGDLLNLLGEAP